MDREYLEESRRRRDLDKERLERFRRRREEVKRRREQNVAEEQTMYPGAGAGYSKSLDELLNEETESFQDMLFRIIDRKGLKDPEVYKKANLDRKLFSKIRSSKKYLPQKKTVLALAIALELNMDETLDLMRRAGITLNPNNRFDKIVAYCIRHKIYNIYEINTYLFEYDSPDAVLCSADLYYDSLDDLKEEWNGLIDRRGWIDLGDPLPGCQHDAFLPLRVKGRNTGNPQWGTYEILKDGAWVEYKTAKENVQE